jgi:hypothetical protein
VRAVLALQEKTRFYLFEALDADDVREAATRAGLRPERVVEVRSDWTAPPLVIDLRTEGRTGQEPTVKFL